MHRALRLPEIVTAIVRAGKTEPRFLYNCLFVNKLFSYEACRILWKGCYGIFGVDHVTPKISDLGDMVLRADIGPARAQVYANFIRILVFQEDEFTSDDDAQWHAQLRQLQFPLLEDLNIWRTKSAERANTEETILHYVHSGLRDLRVDASGPLSDHFLDELSRLCPRLQQLDIDFKNVTISKAGLAHFFKRMSSLEGIHVAALEFSWSIEAFLAVARYERLKLLHIPVVPDAWFDSPQLASILNPFPALKYLYCLGMTGKALRRLHNSNPGVEALHLYNGNLTERELVLPAAALFSRLTNFRYQPGPKADVTGQDLLRLARGCPSLTSLSVGQDQTPLPVGTEIDDNVVTSLAKALPHLKELILLYASTSYPSIASILSTFTHHSPMLHRLEICCGADWNLLVTSQNTYVLPKLWSILLWPQGHMMEVLSESDYDVVLACFKESAERWFPKVEFFNIEDADDWEQQLLDHMYEVADMRELDL